LADGVPSEPFSLLTNQVQRLTLQIESGADALCTTSGVNGDADMFLRFNTAPNIDQFLFDCVSNNAFSNETCRVLNPGSATTIWASVVAFASFVDLIVTCTSTQLAATTPTPIPETDASPPPSSKPTSSPVTSGAIPISFVRALLLFGSLLPLWW
jgi:vibriolysin